MSRDASGNYTLPLSAVVAGTAITATWANTTLDDIEAELDDSLDRYGRGGMTAALENIDGTVNAPGISFSSEPNSGFRRSATNVMNAVVDGTDIAKWYDDTGTGAGSQRPFQIWDGSAYFSPLDPSGSLGAQTFATVGSSAASTVGNALTVTAGGLNIDAGGATITGDSDITGDLTVSGQLETSHPGLVGCYINGTTGFRVASVGIGNCTKASTGKYTVTLQSGTWTDTSYPTVMACAAGSSSVKMYASVEKATSNTMTVIVRDLTTNTLTDNDCVFFGVR